MHDQVLKLECNPHTCIRLVSKICDMQNVYAFKLLSIPRQNDNLSDFIFQMGHNGHGNQGPENADVSNGEVKQLVKMTVQRPIRTCFILCLSFFFVYTANLAIQNLQSSLHETAGLGITSLAVLYGAIIGSSLCLCLSVSLTLSLSSIKDN